MPTCFVIQPFDSGPFDKRYEDTLSPAITEAGLEPYRVDRDPGVVIPIDQIEEGIRNSQACIADISRDNPNVWFELGYAIAQRKPVVLLALHDPARSFPFDIQHRHVIRYRTESVSDFASLAREITARLRAILEKEERIDHVAAQPSSIADVEGLSQHELVALVSIAENLDTPAGDVSAYTVRKDMERAGFTRVATTLALGQLARKQFVTYTETREWNGESYGTYSLTDDGMGWLQAHQHLLILKRDPAIVQEAASVQDEDEEIPF